MGGQSGSPADGRAGEAWDRYVRVVQALSRTEERLSAVPEPALRASGNGWYRVLFRYLVTSAPPRVRAMFLGELMDETLVATIFTQSSVAAIGSVDTATVRAHLPGFARRLLQAEPHEMYPTALHVLWLYGEFAAVRAVLRTWREILSVEDPLDDELDGFEGTHPMPGTGEAEADAWLAALPAAPDVAAGPAPAPGAVAEAGLLWDALDQGYKTLRWAWVGPGKVGIGADAVLRHALSVPGDPAYVARLLVDRFGGVEEMTAAAGVIGADFCAVFFPLLLQIAASSVAAGIRLLPVLRGTARALGRDDLAQRAVDVERACYGTFDKTGLLVRIRD